MIRRAALAVCLALPPLTALRAQAPPPLPTSVAELRGGLTSLAALPDPHARAAALDALWAALRDAGQVPFRAADSVAFLYRGEAEAISVAGDHTGWAARPLPLVRVPGTDLWLRAERLPAAARIDYKLVVDGEWLLDPANPHAQMSGFGPNSELRMPGWAPSPYASAREDVPVGALSPPLSLHSAALGHPLTYRVYTPAGYEGLSDLPVVYVTDGHEYADPALGALPVVLDNLIAEGRAAPALVVLVDPRVGGENLRHALYLSNPAFAAFVAEELVPAVDAAYRTRPERDARVVLGTSFGGVFALYLGLRHPEAFGKLAAQSPALWVTESPRWEGPSLFEQAAAGGGHRLEVSLSAGTINDGGEGAVRMRDALLAAGHEVSYAEVPEGHSWGQWRALLGGVLTALLPAEAP